MRRRRQRRRRRRRRLLALSSRLAPPTPPLPPLRALPSAAPAARRSPLAQAPTIWAHLPFRDPPTTSPPRAASSGHSETSAPPRHRRFPPPPRPHLPLLHPPPLLSLLLARRASVSAILSLRFTRDLSAFINCTSRRTSVVAVVVDDHRFLDSGRIVAGPEYGESPYPRKSARVAYRSAAKDRATFLARLLSACLPTTTTAGHRRFPLSRTASFHPHSSRSRRHAPSVNHPRERREKAARLDSVQINREKER